MPAIGTGAILANRHLVAIGVSGDGDTASIGIGQFVHLLRRNVPMIYIMENNGVYGLTKGQFSATADMGSTPEDGSRQTISRRSTAAFWRSSSAADYVARSFAGDPKQLVALLQGALAHRGTAFLDVISPCVTFNNHEGSTKSYKYAKESEELLHEIGFVPSYEQITVEYEPGTTKSWTCTTARRSRSRNWNGTTTPRTRPRPCACIRDANAKGEFLTGLLYIDPNKPDFTQVLNMHDEPLASLSADRVRPSREALDEIMESLR